MFQFLSQELHLLYYFLFLKAEDFLLMITGNLTHDVAHQMRRRDSGQAEPKISWEMQLWYQAQFFLKSSKFQGKMNKCTGFTFK